MAARAARTSGCDRIPLDALPVRSLDVRPSVHHHTTMHPTTSLPQPRYSSVSKVRRRAMTMPRPCVSKTRFGWGSKEGQAAHARHVAVEENDVEPRRIRFEQLKRRQPISGTIDRVSLA